MEDGHLDPAPIWSDVASFDGGAWRGKVDLVSAGYPCQPFSVAGRRRGDADARHVWPHIARILAEVRPALAFLENVPGHVSLGLRDVCADLRCLGYEVSAGVYSAAECGAPHIRKRLFILAAHPDRSVVWDKPKRHQSWAEADPEPCYNGAPRALADAHSKRQLQPEGIIPDQRRRIGDGSLCDADGTRPPQRQGRCTAHEQPAFVGAGGWASEPQVGRVVDGFPGRVDRLRALGNAVVPAVAARAFADLLGAMAEAPQYLTTAPGRIEDMQPHG